MDTAQQFEICVQRSRNKQADYVFTCKKGLWEVVSYSSPKGYREAMHYFQQYKEDGEYHEFIGGPTLLQALGA